MVRKGGPSEGKDDWSKKSDKERADLITGKTPPKGGGKK